MDLEVQAGIDLAEQAILIGGLDQPPKPADSEIQGICDQVRKAVEERVHGGKPFEQYTAKTYIRLVTTGADYRIKVQISEDVLIRIRVFLFVQTAAKPIPPELLAVASDGLLSQPF